MCGRLLSAAALKVELESAQSRVAVLSAEGERSRLALQAVAELKAYLRNKDDAISEKSRSIAILEKQLQVVPWGCCWWSVCLRRIRWFAWCGLVVIGCVLRVDSCLFRWLIFVELCGFHLVLVRTVIVVRVDLLMCLSFLLLFIPQDKTALLARVSHEVLSYAGAVGFGDTGAIDGDHLPDILHSCLHSKSTLLLTLADASDRHQGHARTLEELLADAEAKEHELTAALQGIVPTQCVLV